MSRLLAVPGLRAAPGPYTGVAMSGLSERR